MRTRLRKLLLAPRFTSGFPGLAAMAGLLLALVPCLLGRTAAAGAELDAREPRWIPSLDVGFETFAYSTESTVTNLVNPPFLEGTDSNDSYQLMVQLGGQLMGPSFEWLPGHPRPFARAGVGFPTFSSSRIFQLGDVQGDTALDITSNSSIRQGDLNRDRRQPPVLPDGNLSPGRNGVADCIDVGPPDQCYAVEPEDLAGQFSKIDAEFQMPSVYAALGLSFDFPLGRSVLLRAKPSIAYNMDQIDLAGGIRTVTETLPRIPDQLQQFEIHEAFASSSSTDHSLGLGLELGVGLFRAIRPIRTTLYLDMRFLWLVNESTTTFSDSVATYQVDRDPFDVRGGAGVRFSWVGFGAR